HLSVSNVSRASGSRATATLSYISGRRVHDERRGETYDYGRKERVLRVGTLLPEGAPAEFADPAVLFNAVELHETGRTARPAKKIVVALPREFTPRQRVQALEEYIRENLNADGYAATYAIHEDREGNNPHAHILVANRQIDPATGGWARLKQRMEYVLDERGERVPLIDPETGRQKTDKRGRRQWKRTSVSLNPLDRKAKLKALRESWAKTCNARLDETARIDHRSLEDQGSDLEPTIHEGYAARAIERAGGVSERCEANREIRRSNGLLTAIRTELGRIFDRLGELFAAKIRQLRQRPSGAPQAPSSPEPAERPQERPQARETPPQAPQEPPKPIRTKKALTDRFKTRLDERLAENERKQAEKQAEPDMEETWDLSDPADPLNIGMGWGTGGHGLGL
ncbi:MobA/MobL family protein, partial [Bifidobacterium longum]|uniref:MobA/MobL family protein n=2 Tax=Bifidobacterium TaxID=1678 RepID=UPI00345EB879